jgi:hypothetical protein
MSKKKGCEHNACSPIILLRLQRLVGHIQDSRWFFPRAACPGPATAGPSVEMTPNIKPVALRSRVYTAIRIRHRESAGNPKNALDRERLTIYDGYQTKIIE